MPPNTPPISFDAQLGAIDAAAHESAFGFGKQRPSDARCNAGNYKVGRVQWQGLPLCIEQPYGSVREKTSKTTGRTWRNVMAAHYGYLEGTKGADGDPVDCFIGTQVDSTTVYVINQGFEGRFDEHKVMLCFHSEEAARTAYLGSYETGWTGLESCVPMTLSQFKWWLKFADLSVRAVPEHLPYVPKETEAMKPTAWTADALPSVGSLDQLLYDIRRDDGDAGLLLDSASMAEILSDPANTSVLMMDALVTPFAKVDQRMGLLRAAMDHVDAGVTTVAMQVSDPFKQRGTVNVAVVYELSDGQTVSVYLHNPDATPAQLAPQDELISWKWALNKKDVTIVVAPENGKDLNVREVARRIMRLAAKNSAAFQRANANRAERLQAIEGLKGEVAGLEGELAAAQRDLELARLEHDEFQMAQVVKQAQAEAARKAAQEQEPHYSEKVIQALVEGHGWSKDQPTTAKKYFPGVRPGGLVVKDGGRDFYATYRFDGERQRYIGLVLADTEFFNLDTRDRDPADVAREFNDRAEAVVQEMRDKLAGEQTPTTGLTGELGERIRGLMEKIAAAQGSLTERAIAYPSPEDFMRDVNAGNRNGFSLERQRADFAQNSQDLEAVRAGRLSATKVVGRGGTKKAALQWLEDKGAELAHAISTGGFERTINLYNYLSTLGALARTGQDDGFTSTEELAKQEQERAAAEAARNAKLEAEQAELQAKVQSNQQYETGSTSGIKQPLVLTYSVPADNLKVLAALVDAQQPEAQYQVLEAAKLPSRGMEQFNTQVDFNRARKNGVEFAHFEIAPRQGRYHVELTIDLAGAAKSGNDQKLAQIVALAENIAKALQTLGWTVEKLEQPGRWSYKSPRGSEYVAEPDTTYFAGLDIDGAIESPGRNDDPVKAAEALERDDWAHHAPFAHEGEKVTDEESVWDGQPLAFVYANEALEQATEAAGASLVWGDFNASLHNASLFDGATHHGVSAQIGKDGHVLARAAISATGLVTLYAGSNGDTVVLEATQRHQLQAAIEAMVAAMPAEQAPATEQQPEPAQEPQTGPVPADTVVSRLNALSKAVPRDAIKSDDPQAYDKLQAKLAYLEGRSAMMRDANKLVRKNDRAGLAAMGFSDKAIEGLFTKDFAGRLGFPDYDLKNTNAEARRTRQRLEPMWQARQQAEAAAAAAAKASAYTFANVLAGDDGFQAWIEASPARLETAKVIDQKALALGAHVLWFTPPAEMSATALDSAMSHAIAALAIVGSTAAHNGPIHASTGNAAQAALSEAVAASASDAVKVLAAFDAGQLTLADGAILDSATGDGAPLCGTLVLDRKPRGYVGIRPDGKAMIYTDSTGLQRMTDTEGNELALAIDQGAAVLVELALLAVAAEPSNGPRITAGAEYSYALAYRPAGPGATPAEGFMRVVPAPQEIAAYARHGVAIYSRELTEQELKQFELRRVRTDAERAAAVEAIAQHFAGHKYAANYYEYVQEGDMAMLEGTMRQELVKQYPFDAFPNAEGMPKESGARFGVLMQAKQPEQPQNTDPERAKAIATLQSLVDGTADALEADFDALEAIYNRYQTDDEVTALFEKASEVVANAALAATA